MRKGRFAGLSDKGLEPVSPPGLAELLLSIHSAEITARVALACPAEGQCLLRIEALLSADLIAVMNNGHLVQVGTPHELMNQPADAYVAALMSNPKQQTQQLEALAAGHFAGGRA